MRTMLAGWLGASALVGCDPSLPEARRAGGDAGGASLVVTTEPAGPLSAVAPAVRLRFAGGLGLAPEAVALVRGELGPTQLREIARGEPSATLRKRVVPAVAFLDGADVVLAPTALLEPGERYTAAAGTETVPIEVAAEDARVLPRIWPPAGSATRAPFAVWCGAEPQAQIDEEARLSPDGPRGRLIRGAVAGGAGARCLRFEAEGSAQGSWVPPIAAGGVLLEPALVQADGVSQAVPTIGCEDGEIPFGPGCARFADDRLRARAPGTALLWAVAGAGVDAVIATGAGDPFAISGLPPSTDVTLDVAAIDEHGTVLRMLTSAVTGPPMPHPILNEVLANPLGPEPASEWLEIVNDGCVPLELGGYAISDGGGTTTLPPATLAPGAFALVVNETYSEQEVADAAPAPGTLLVRVPHLGTNGLSNSGEPLALTDPAGRVVSRFPAGPKPKAGLSVARRSPSSPDDAEDAFARATPTPGRPNVL